MADNKYPPGYIPLTIHELGGGKGQSNSGGRGRHERYDRGGNGDGGDGRGDDGGRRSMGRGGRGGPGKGGRRNGGRHGGGRDRRGGGGPRPHHSERFESETPSETPAEGGEFEDFSDIDDSDLN